ncbi:MAG: CHASE2 domain-containing protein [Chthoniobacterales bacterium]
MAAPSRIRRKLGRSHRRTGVIFLLCAAWAVLFALFAGWLNVGPLELAELSLQDTVVRHGVRAATPADYVFLALDEASLELSQLEPEEIEASPALTAMAAEFPWSRVVYAEAIEKMLSAGAKVVVLDAHFPLPHTGDEKLRATLAAHPGRVVIASLYADTELSSARHANLFHPPSDTVLPENSAGAVGFANFWPEPDRVVRGAHYRMSDGQMLDDARVGGGVRSSLGALALQHAGLREDLPAFGLVRFSTPGSFPVVPLWQIFVPDFWSSNLKDGEIFRDKIVFFGPLAARFRDFVRTPVGTLSGPEVHLHAMAAAQLDEFYRRAAPGLVAATCLLMGLLAFGTNLLVRRPLAAFGVLGLLLLGYGGLALLLFNYAAFVPGMFYPSATLVFAGLTAFAYDFSLERREKARVRRSLERYVSRDLVHELLDHDSDFLSQLGGTRKEVAVLFSDLRGFTALCERSDPAVLVGNLNEYLASMVEIVFRHRGTLDKFIGDAVMAVWGTVGSVGSSGDCARAVQAALDMLAEVVRLGRDWEARGVSGLHVGIGIHHGPAIFGNIGSELKMEPTVIGDTVNLTSRMESLTKRYHQPLLVSDAVVDLTRGAFPFRTIDTVRVVGRQNPVTIWTVPVGEDGRAFLPDWLESNEQGWVHYRARRFAEALVCFEEALGLAPDDHCLHEMAGRCRSLMHDPPGPEWQPVVNLESK